ncbi:MAG TPA: hypothetical protein VK716_01170 [Terracidiphilus sp.]|jgi:uncharacterized membrane protein YhaH (DUF805 family)|nr:hypothetical protein [Terracidiphilus sp.]
MRRLSFKRVRLTRPIYIAQFSSFAYAIDSLGGDRPDQPIWLDVARLTLFLLCALMTPLSMIARLNDIGWRSWWLVPLAFPWIFATWAVKIDQQLWMIGIAALVLIVAQAPLILTPSRVDLCGSEEHNGYAS